MQLSRRDMLKLMGTTGAGLAVAACAPAASTGPETAAEAAPGSAATDLTIWFHWGGETGNFAQELIDSYNEEQGADAGINVTIDTVPGDEFRQKMTAVRLAGTPPDVYHASIPIMELVENEVVAELPDEEQAYVRENYIEAAVERMTYEGKVWGYPTEHQAPALIYRKSFFEEAGISEPPTDTLAVRELARELTREEGGVKYYGFLQWYDNYPANFHFPGIIWRHGGEFVEFEGDVPVKIMVDTPEANAALGWWRSMVDDGSTQVGEMPFTDAWQNGLAAMAEIEPWFPFINLRDAGVEDIYEDLGVVHVPPASGVDPVVQSGGWELVLDRASEYPEEQVSFARWMMHGPDMPFSRFIVERIGSLPAPIDYPTPIPGWSDAMIEGYANQTAPITRMTPTLKILGSGEINNALNETVQAVMLQQKEVAPALVELQTQLDEILERTDGDRW